MSRGSAPAPACAFAIQAPAFRKMWRKRCLSLFFSSKEEGTGLGLSIANRIIMEHGGMFKLEHEEDMGACFFRRPAFEGGRIVATILIVDDDPQLRQSFERILQEEEHLVHTASSGEAGLVKVEQGQAGSGDHGRPHARNGWVDHLQGDPENRAAPARYHHDRFRHNGNGH